MEEGDRPRWLLGEEGAEHRDQRGDAAAAGDQEDRVGAGVGQVELAVGRGEAEDHPRRGALGEEIRDQAAGMAA